MVIMNEVELKKIWDNLQGKLDVGTFDKFKSKMSDTDSRKRFYDKYYNKLLIMGVELGEYDIYEKTLSSTGIDTPPLTTTKVDTCIVTHFKGNSAFSERSNAYVINIDEKTTWVFFKDFMFSIRNSKNINQYATGYDKTNGDGKWVCDGNDDFIITYNNKVTYSSKNLGSQPENNQPLSGGSQSTSEDPPVTPEDDSEILKLPFDLKYPYDKNYRYSFHEGNWYAKNINNNKIFNISKYPQFKKSVENLNREFPNGIQPTTTTTTPGQ